MNLRLCFLFAVVLTFCCSSKTSAQGRLAPTHANVAYDTEHSAQVLDFYRTESVDSTPVVVYIHGGGWRAGTKDRVPAYLLRGVGVGLFSVASVEYRFTDVAPHPAQTDDCLRAVQFVRSKAGEWNIDPDRVGVTGGSAGGHLSLFVALHDDIANAESEDPVERQNSKATCAIGFAGPTDWGLLGTIEHAHPGYRQLIGYEPGATFESMDAARRDSVSPITYASSDDPPVLIVHGDADDIVPVEHATELHAALEEAGAESEIYLVKDADHGVSGAGSEELATLATRYFTKHLVEVSKKTQ